MSLFKGVLLPCRFLYSFSLLSCQAEFSAKISSDYGGTFSLVTILKLETRGAEVLGVRSHRPRLALTRTATGCSCGVAVTLTSGQESHKSKPRRDEMNENYRVEVLAWEVGVLSSKKKKKKSVVHFC